MANVLDRNFDFATNGTVTAAGLHNLIDETNIYAGLISTQEERTSVGTADLLLIANSSSIASPQIAANRTTVYNLFEDALTGGTYVNAQLSGNLTYGTATGGRTISTGANITNGTISTLIAGTTTSTAEIVTSGTITTLNSTTPTFLGAITASTNTINIGSGQIYKDASGNVGIGTASPTVKLNVSGGATSSIRNDSTGTTINEYSQSINYAGNGAYYAQTVAYGNGFCKTEASPATNQLYQILTASSSAIAFATNNIERMRIGATGDVTIGDSNPSLTAGIGAKFIASSTIPSIGFVADTAGAATQYHYYNVNATNNGFRFYVNSNGGISNFSANNVNLSDERLKTNISIAGNYLDKICSIPVKTFNYKDQGEDTEKTIGVLAQEVEAHIPELINNDGFGETPADGIPLKTIYQTDLQYVLMRCIQELKSENTSLKSRIEALEAK